ncbi:MULTISPECIES: hypothetical protein [Jeotgalibacillus]|uniref:hypothetical protein n=1 Tax=Jeotgalibacillus TaxID=157226 RepID=UPI00106A6B6E|nr:MULTISPECIES: hypothetical protein [Jeotgalibacillus]TFD99881.1 hypothetical protein E2491_05390 [Jeotgalibacillus sp. R-1-5s-1]
MLTFEEKLKVIESFDRLTRHNVSLGRVNFHFEESIREKKTVVYHLHPNGNGFVFTAHLNDFDSDAKGMTNIRDFSEEELRSIIQASMDSLLTEELADFEPFTDEPWVNENGQELVLTREDADTWSVYADEMLDGIFTTYEEAASYLDQEGFSKKTR